MPYDLLEHRLGRCRGRNMSYSSSECWKRQRRDAVLVGEREEGFGGSPHDLRGRLEVGTHNAGVDDVGRAQVTARLEDRLADFNRALPHRLFLDDDAALALDGRGDTGSHGEVGVGGIGDGIDVPIRDVAALDRNARLTDLEL